MSGEFAERAGRVQPFLAVEILERAHVGTPTGVGFGAAGEGMLRFCYAVSEETIAQALTRLARVLPELEAAKT